MKSRRLIVSPATKTEHRAAFKLFSRGLMLDMSGVHTYRLPNVAGLPPTPVFIGEGQPAPNVQWTFAATVLGPVKKTLILSAVTGEVERGGPWSSAAIIGKVLADASNRSIDTIAFDTNAGDAVRPPGLLHGVTPVAGAATGVDAVFEDRATLAGAIQLSDTPDASSPTKSMWQTDIISIKVRANAAWAVMPGGAAVITAVNW
jgi:hypothetical protein